MRTSKEGDHKTKMLLGQIREEEGPVFCANQNHAAGQRMLRQRGKNLSLLSSNEHLTTTFVAPDTG